MKIGVLTFWYGKANYGMMLQCWAMQQVLREMGHQPYIIRYTTQKKKGLPRKILETLGLYNMILRYINPLKYQQNIKKEAHNQLRRFDDFRQNNLQLSTKIYKTLKELQTTPPVADCYIVGSDQVWSQILSCDNNKAFFLDFGEQRTKRVSYAPSFGIKEYPTKYIETLKFALSKFDVISCREQEGVDICKRVGYQATKVLDPTFLLHKERYLDLCSKCKPFYNNQYAYIYSLNITNKYEIRYDELEKYLKKKKYGLVVTPGDGYIQGEEIFGDDVFYSYSTIEQWLCNIYNSSLFVTSSFHGIAISILLEKPFVYVPLVGMHSNSNGRILELLSDLNLMDRVLTTNRSYADISDSKIDWKSVKDHLENYISQSKFFLQSNLD